ncbi:hypothetical protein [Dyadobacter sp. CY312]|uniref:hypothetical protein n=1 Tax=Dyadobacter sp. CY312 TaxID=2907303 RepID=UPI001F3578C0|nr:hypothetical protein [Dyadobacter sp. CY312]MCE7044402.1 hypothetical protein [Dyadobacter sp. CY312]
MKKYLIYIILPVSAACTRSPEVEPTSKNNRQIVLQNPGDFVITGAFLDFQNSVWRIPTELPPDSVAD